MSYRGGGLGPREPVHDEATALLRALALVQRALILRASELRGDPAFSEVTYELSMDGPTQLDDFSEDLRAEIRRMRDAGNRQIVFSGYVDVTPDGHLGAAWLFDVAEGAEDGWVVNRVVTLYPLEGDDVDLVLTTTSFAGWAEVADRLPQLVAELLATPLPSPSR